MTVSLNELRYPMSQLLSLSNKVGGPAYPALLRG